MSRPLCFHKLALSQWDKIALHADGVLGFRPNNVVPPGRPSSKNGTTYGHVLNVARRIDAGAYGDRTVAEVARAEGCAFDSLKSTLWQVQHPKRKERVA